MSGGHRKFEVDCALALSGALSESEIVALSEHAKDCVECARRLEDMMCVGSLLADARGRKGPGTPAGMMERFAARASAEGVVPKGQRQESQPLAALGIVAMASLALVLFAHRGKAPVMPHELAAATSAGELHQSAQVPAPEVPSIVRPMRIRHGGVHRRTASAARWLKYPMENAPEARAQFTLRADHVSSWNRAALVWTDSSSGCDEAARPLLSKLGAGGPNEKRVFCYNPRMAALDSLDLFHAAALNAPPAFNVQALAIRFPAIAEQ